MGRNITVIRLQREPSNKSQDDIPDTIPAGSKFIYCLPPKVKIIGQCDRSAKAIPVISSVDGSILSIELTRRGRGYKFPPKICIIDKTRFGGGAIAEAKIDRKGRVTQIYLLKRDLDIALNLSWSLPINPPQDDPDGDPRSLDPNNLQFPNPFKNDCDKVARLREKTYKGGPRIELERDFIWVDQKTGREFYCPNFDPQVPTEPGPRPDPDDPEGPELPDETPFVPIKDLENPYVIFTSPADNTSGIVTSANISITFSEEVVRGTGKIKISS